MANEDHIDEAIDRLQRIIQLMGEQQSALDRRISTLAKLALFDLLIVVVSISLLVVILSVQAPELRQAVASMNLHFAAMSDDLFEIRRSMGRITGDVAVMPRIVGHVDSMHGNVGRMGEQVGTMTERVATMNQSLSRMQTQVGDMALSFQVMDDTILRMTLDVQHLSKPMRFFNQMNPFR